MLEFWRMGRPGLQVEAWTAAGGVEPFREVASGAGNDRGQLRKALAALEDGDGLIVAGVDCLARPTRDQLNTLAASTDRTAGVRSLGDAWVVTTTPHGQLRLTVLGGLAEFERELIRAGTSEGRARVVARGVRLGRTPKLTQHQVKENLRRKADGATVREIARSYNVHNITILRLKT